MDEQQTLFCGDRMRELRARIGISQAALAEKVNVSRVQITNIENGISEPSLSSLIAIAVALHTTTDFLLAVERYKHEKPKKVMPLPFDNL